MLKTMLKATVFATTLTLSAGVFYAPAFAEVVYNRGSAAEPQSVDPHKTSTVYEANVLRDLFQGLVMQDEKANVIPGAAESWTVSDDGTVYTFKLRKGGVWSDGSPVTADDFVFAFHRLEDPATGAEYASMLYPVKGAEDFNTNKGKAEDMGVKAIDAILAARRWRRLRLADIARLTASLAKVRPFLIAEDWRPVALADRADLHALVAPKGEQLELFAA